MLASCLSGVCGERVEQSLLKSRLFLMVSLASLSRKTQPILTMALGRGNLLWP